MSKDYIDLDRVTDEEFKETLEELTNTPGWEMFAAELHNLADSLSDVQTIKDGDDLCYRKGCLAMIGFILNYPTIINEYEDTPEVTH